MATETRRSKREREADTPHCIEPLPQDGRFAHEAWRCWPYNVIYQAFLLNQQWRHNATTGVRGVSSHNEQAVTFITRQLLEMWSPSNIPFFNPEIVQTTIEEADRFIGPNLWQHTTPTHEGSWWPVWQQWLRQHSTDGVEPPSIGAPDRGYPVLGNAPGTYVYQQ